MEEFKGVLDKVVKYGLFFEYKGFYSIQYKLEWVVCCQDNN